MAKSLCEARIHWRGWQGVVTVPESASLNSDQTADALQLNFQFALPFHFNQSKHAFKHKR